MDYAAFIVAIIERAREERGMSIAELSRRSLIERKRLWYILHGERILRADEFVRLCIVMNLGFKYFATPELIELLRAHSSPTQRDAITRACNTTVQRADKKLR